MWCGSGSDGCEVPAYTIAGDTVAWLLVFVSRGPIMFEIRKVPRPAQKWALNNFLVGSSSFHEVSYYQYR